MQPAERPTPMSAHADDPKPGDNPLLSSDPDAWRRLIERVGPPSILVVIAHHMGPRMRSRMTPEDVWQETLMHAWQSRLSFRWEGIPGFRRWLITIARNRIHDLRQAGQAKKRGGGSATRGLDTFGCPPADSIQASGTTPGRNARDHERAVIMGEALDALSDELREVVRLGLFEDVGMEEVARRVGIHPQAARRRFRKGCKLYYDRVESTISTAQKEAAVRQNQDRNPL